MERKNNKGGKWGIKREPKENMWRITSPPGLV
jgi:hypothetical protein